jgi:hypothetical protein
LPLLAESIIERKFGNTMNKNMYGIVGTVLVVVLVIWLVGGNSITCRDSFWDKDKKVIEIKTNK